MPGSGPDGGGVGAGLGTAGAEVGAPARGAGQAKAVTEWDLGETRPLLVCAACIDHCLM